MLQLVSNDGRLDRLSIAAAHVEAAIAHINNEAQARVPWSPSDDTGEIEALRLLVHALADIRNALRNPDGFP